MIPYKKVAFHTLGCKLNFSETSTISRLFKEQGFARVNMEERPDVVVFNTCSVTDNADKKCRQLVRKAMKHNPDAFVVMVGCYAQLKPKEIAAISGVDLVLGANEKFNVLEHLDSIEKKKRGEVQTSNIKEVSSFMPSYSYGDRTRSFLKVQDGCDYFCSFCTIPLARGKSRSNTIAQTIKTAKEVEAKDIKEVVLTGVNIGDFGAGTEESFLDLIVELDQLKGIGRYRISSIEPNLLSDEIIERVAASEKFAPHFHIPLQSGSDNTLKKMRRKYLSGLYEERISTIKRLMPHSCIGADVIVGFPGETPDDFMRTYDFLNKLDISYLHVFTYSERPNTTAVKLDGVVPAAERSERSKMLHILSEKKKRRFYEQNIGKRFTVLFEAENKEEMMYGFTENYIKVKMPYQPEAVNKFCKLKLERIDRDGVMVV